MNDDDAQKSRVKDQFTRQASSYSGVVESSQVRSRPGFDRIEFIRPRGDDRVLDIACGTGSLALSLAPHVQWVTGIDLTPAMIEQARLAQQRASAQNLDWHIGDVAVLPFADDSFSLGVCSAAFHHMDNPLQALRELRRVCRGGGRIMINDVTPEPATRVAFDGLEQLKDPSHTRALTLAELRGLGVEAGLDELRVTRYEATFPLDLIMKTVFPEAVTVAEICDRYRQDAEAGDNQLGVNAHLRGDELWVSYPMSAVLWNVGKEHQNQRDESKGQTP